MFWPYMSGDVELKDYIQFSRCDYRYAFGPMQRKETLICHKVPDRQWAKIAADLFEFQQMDRIFDSWAASVTLPNFGFLIR